MEYKKHILFFRYKLSASIKLLACKRKTRVKKTKQFLYKTEQSSFLKYSYTLNTSTTFQILLLFSIDTFFFSKNSHHKRNSCNRNRRRKKISMTINFVSSQTTVCFYFQANQLNCLICTTNWNVRTNKLMPCFTYLIIIIIAAQCGCINFFFFIFFFYRENNFYSFTNSWKSCFK